MPPVVAAQEDQIRIVFHSERDAKGWWVDADEALGGAQAPALEAFRAALTFCLHANSGGGGLKCGSASPSGTET